MLHSSFEFEVPQQCCRDAGINNRRSERDRRRSSEAVHGTRRSSGDHGRER
ncbi:unnamed protein product [Brassica napus]|uniref:(rape) hypothetical protein n=1 Tax=Brassica napus TaxID=3708 RepID=A0A816ULD0_BRANA|nr:unnamed protein product [Brassica napus]